MWAGSCLQARKRFSPKPIQNDGHLCGEFEALFCASFFELHLSFDFFLDWNSSYKNKLFTQKGHGPYMLSLASTFVWWQIITSCLPFSHSPPTLLSQEDLPWENIQALSSTRQDCVGRIGETPSAHYLGPTLLRACKNLYSRGGKSSSSPYTLFI